MTTPAREMTVREAELVDSLHGGCGRVEPWDHWYTQEHSAMKIISGCRGYATLRAMGEHGYVVARIYGRIRCSPVDELAAFEPLQNCPLGLSTRSASEYMLGNLEPSDPFFCECSWCMRDSCLALNVPDGWWPKPEHACVCHERSDAIACKTTGDDEPLQKTPELLRALGGTFDVWVDITRSKVLSLWNANSPSPHCGLGYDRRSRELTDRSSCAPGCM